LRLIVDRDITWKRRCSGSNRLVFSWAQVKVTTLKLECGHTKVYRGDYAPVLRVKCDECAKEGQETNQ
jgi:ribosomal protein S27E